MKYPALLVFKAEVCSQGTSLNFSFDIIPLFSLYLQAILEKLAAKVEDLEKKFLNMPKAAERDGEKLAQISICGAVTEEKRQTSPSERCGSSEFFGVLQLAAG